MKNDDTRNPSGSVRGPFDEAKGENDALWNLLGEVCPVEVSPFFARNVLREIRKPASASQLASASLWKRVKTLRWRFAPAAAAMVLLMGVTVSQITGEHQSKASKHATERKDYEVISNLDTLLAAEESSLWLDDSEQ